MRRLMITTAITMFVAAPAAAQAPAARPADSLRNQRYQITTMEKVLEGAVEYGARVTRDRLQAIAPADVLLSADMLLSDDARVRGYRLDGYGVFFDVAVPMLEGSLTWSFRTLDQNDLGLQSALSALRTLVQKSGDVNFEQALKRVELQVAPVSLTAASAPDQLAAPPRARSVTGSAAATPTDAPPPVSRALAASPDPILDDPEEAYRAEVRNALMDAMLDHGTALRIAPTELLTVAARGSDDRSGLGPLNDDAQTIMITMLGSDLTGYLSGQISRDEARRRMTVRVF
jgi:hypothetical protein